MVFIQVRSPSPYRISISTDVSPDLTASNYAVTRADGASTAARITNAFSPVPNVVELTIANEALLDGVIYVVTNATFSASGTVSYRQSTIASQVPVAPAEDPEAEAFGIDYDWFADAMTASGDTPQIRGRQCLVNDLSVIALINKGELFHRPDAGAGLKLRTNGPMTDRNVKEVIGTVTREWYKDPRVKPGGIEIKADIGISTGRLALFGKVLPLAIDDPALVKLPGGGT